MNNEVLSLIILGASKVFSEIIRYRPLATGTAPQPESSLRVVAEAPKGTPQDTGAQLTMPLVYLQGSKEVQKIGFRDKTRIVAKSGLLYAYSRPELKRC